MAFSREIGRTTITRITGTSDGKNEVFVGIDSGKLRSFLDRKSAIGSGIGIGSISGYGIGIGIGSGIGIRFGIGIGSRIGIGFENCRKQRQGTA